MIRVFKHYLPYAVLLLGAVDFVLLMLAAEAGWALRLWQLEGGLHTLVYYGTSLAVAF